MPEYVRQVSHSLAVIPTAAIKAAAAVKQTMAIRNDAVYVQIGEKEVPGAHCVRIVHISDTHTRHSELRSYIPDGDILIHSGDFDNYSIMWSMFPQAEIDRLQSFFASLPHEHKIFVAGNHDMKISDFVNKYSADELRQRLPSCIYLQDSAITLRGINFYGTPWTPLRKSSRARGFSKPWGSLVDEWKKIPDDVDVLITHIPPWDELKEEIQNRIKPKACLHGHIHRHNGVTWLNDNILVSNAAMESIHRPVIIDYYTTHPDAKPSQHVKRKTQSDQALTQKSGCAIM